MVRGRLDRTALDDPVRAMKQDVAASKTAIYLILLAIQIAAALVFVWEELPEFRRVVINPGVQLPYDSTGDLATAAIFLVMQISFWCRVLYIPIPRPRPNMLLNYVFLFLGRLSFIFGSALFSVVVFRHLPELDLEIDLVLAIKRGTILVACLFALFCTSLEVERLGHAFEENRH
jgi:hypothetical protein